MKVPAAVVLGTFLLAGLCSAAEKPKIEDEKEKINYSVGYQIGGDFKRQGIDLRPEFVVEGIRDALSGTEPRMTSQEMRKTLMDLKKRIVAEEEKKRKEKAGNGKKEGVVILKNPAAP